MTQETIISIVLSIIMIYVLATMLRTIYIRGIDKPKACHNCKSKSFRFNYGLRGTVFTTHFWICNKCGHETRIQYKDRDHKDHKNTPARVETKTDRIYKVNK